MTELSEPQRLMGRNAIDSTGTKIGKIGQVYLDDGTGQPLWVTVSTGMLGTKQSFAPLYGSRLDGDDVRLAVSKDLVKGAPNVEDDGHLEDSENDALYRYYAGYLGAQAPAAAAGTGRRDESGDDAMTRSEERLHVGTENVEAGRVRLRKYVVTENVSQTVPVTREEVRVEREPITEANRDAAVSGPDISEAEHEVTLHEERPVVEKETVPVERVRLGTESVTDQQTVEESVRKEHIETEGDNTRRGETR
jgi:uncharacterized protein (TIGR02271 family)